MIELSVVQTCFLCSTARYESCACTTTSEPSMRSLPASYEPKIDEPREMLLEIFSMYLFFLSLEGLM